MYGVAPDAAVSEDATVEVIRDGLGPTDTVRISFHKALYSHNYQKEFFSGSAQTGESEIFKIRGKI